jgi:hypothetical protein
LLPLLSNRELDHPKDLQYGVDPSKKRQKAVVLMKYAAYKGKRQLTKFLLRIFIRRVIVRAAAKSLGLIGIPVNALWNGFTCRKSIMDAKAM